MQRSPPAPGDGRASARACRRVERRGVRASSRSRELARVRHDQPRRGRRRGRSHVGREVAERRVLLVPDRAHDRDGAGGDRAHEALVAEGEQVLEAAAAAGEHDHVDLRLGARAGAARRRSRRRRADPARSVSATSTRAGGKRVVTVARTSCFAAASLPVTRPIRRGRHGSAACARRAKSPSAASFAFSRSIAARCVTEAEALDRERPEAEVPARLEELRSPEDVDALAVLRDRAGARRTGRAAS